MKIILIQKCQHPVNKNFTKKKTSPKPKNREHCGEEINKGKIKEKFPDLKGKQGMKDNI